jgi:transcriptional regulator with XRE-family HTH domain
MKKPENATELKIQLHSEIVNGEVTIGDAIRRMRKIIGMTQDQYAKQILKITPRILREIENGQGNPTVETLRKIGKPFGYDVGFVPRKRD